MPQAEFERVVEAYITMAKEAKYRPFAEGDGMGGVYLSPEELQDEQRLLAEGGEYAADFIRQEDAMNFSIGVSNYRTNRALVYTIEAAKCMCAGQDEISLRLLKLAMNDVEASGSEV